MSPYKIGLNSFALMNKFNQNSSISHQELSVMDENVVSNQKTVSNINNCSTYNMYVF